MSTWFQLGDVRVDVVRKKIKNLHLSVLPPLGRVRVAVPERMSMEAVRLFTIDKLPWIRRQQRKLREQERETPREYLERESHFVWDRRYLLAVTEVDQPPSVELSHNRLVLRVRPGAAQARRQEIIEAWYREELRAAATPLIKKWEPVMGVEVRHLFIQRMKTKWGSCTPRSGSIRLNTDLAKKPRECLEYIIVHEMAHFIEHTHNERFVELMDRFMPKWQYHRDVLNRLPVRHEQWEY